MEEADVENKGGEGQNGHTMQPVEMTAMKDELGQNSTKGTPEESRQILGKNEEGVSFRWDVVAWFLGVVFIVVVMLAMIFIGNARGWDANSGYDHNVTESSQERFLAEPFVEEPGVPGRYGPGASARWYYWKLPPAEVTTLTRAIMWLCYVFHQLFMWGCIYYAQRSKNLYPDPSDPRYSTNMNAFNWVPLVGNMVFHLIHLGQTHWTYDALAQDVSEASSQGSVIMLLMFVLMIEYRNRGMAFGWPSKHDTGTISNKLRLPWGPQGLIRRYHGYAFAWAAIYTFWYHPMENTLGHAFGFAHTWMFMLQGSLMYTQLHLNRYWRLLLEAWVIIHGSLVAWQTGGPALDGTLLYPMFMFGFLWMFTMTQLFGLPILQYLPRWTWFLPFIAYMGVGIYVYGWVYVDRQGRYWIRMNEMIRIPATEYLCVMIAWLVLWLFLWLERKLTKAAEKEEQPFQPPSLLKEILCIAGVVLTYAVMVAVAVIIQALDVQMDLIALMIIFVIIFTIGVGVACMLLKQIMPEVSDDGKLVNSHSKIAPEIDNRAFSADEANTKQ